MPKHRQLILRPGMLPMETDRIEWFSDPHFTKLECPPPEVPLLRVEPGLDDGSVVIPARRTR
jgi:type IV secretory pathway TraG/TraD family ATPase VirD4